MADDAQNETPAGEQLADATRTIATGSYSAAAMTVDGRNVLLAGIDGTITRVDLATGTTTATWAVGTSLGGIAVSADGQYLLATELVPGPRYVVDGAYRQPIYVHRTDLSTGTTRTFQADVPISASTFYDVAATRDGKALLSQVGALDDTTQLYTVDIATGAFTATAQEYPARATLTAAPDFSDVLIAPRDAVEAPLYRYTPGAGIALVDDGKGDAGGTTLIAESAGGYALRLIAGRLYLYEAASAAPRDLTALHPELGFRVDGGVIAAAFSRDGASLYLLDASSNALIAIDPATGALQSSVDVGFDVQPARTSDMTIYDGFAYDAFADQLQISGDGRHIGFLAQGDVQNEQTQYQLIDLDLAVARTDLDASEELTGPFYTAYGFGGDDVFTVSGGLLVGGQGDDTYFSPGQVEEQAGGGFDTVYAASFTLPADVERLIGIGSAANLVGNDQANIIVGTPGKDEIRPGGGIDTLTGGGGADLFVGSPAELSGDVLTDFGRDDRLRLAEPNPYGFGEYLYLRALNLTVGADGLSGADGFSLALPSVPLGDLYVRSDFFSSRQYSSGSAEIGYYDRQANLPDFNADAQGDLLWRNADGRVTSWHFAGRSSADTATPQAYIGYADVSWRIVDTFDFDGDRRSDILWRHADGAFSIWKATADGFAPGSYTDSSVGTEWRIAGVADLNRDGRDDMLWQRDDGAISSWLSTGDGFAKNSYFHASPGDTWKVVGLADLDGNGQSDIMWRDAGGAISVWSGIVGGGYAENTYYNRTVDRSWRIEGLADFNGDRDADILWRNDNGAMAVWQSQDRSFFVTLLNNAVPNDWQVASIADFDGDTRSDIVWRNDNGAVSTWEGDNSVTFDAPVFSGFADPSWAIAGFAYQFG